MPFAACSDVKIYYEIKGSGQRLLYISGTGTDLRLTPNVFTSVFPDHFKTLSFDQHGLGQTDKPDEPYGMALYGEDAAALLDTIDWNDCYVIGASFGGMVAQELALNRPELIKKLVLCCTSAGGAGGASYPLHELQHMALEKKIKFRLPKNDKRMDKKWQQENPEKFQELFEQGLKAAQFAANEPGKAIGARRQLEARAQYNTYDRLPELKIPVLVCGGRYDGQAEPEAVENLAKRIPGAELAFFEGGHFFLQQDPKAPKKIVEFLQSD